MAAFPLTAHNAGAGLRPGPLAPPDPSAPRARPIRTPPHAPMVAGGQAARRCAA
jgi:hypothetical protein